MLGKCSVRVQLFCWLKLKVVLNWLTRDSGHTPRWKPHLEAITAHKQTASSRFSPPAPLWHTFRRGPVLGWVSIGHLLYFGGPGWKEVESPIVIYNNRKKKGTAGGIIPLLLQSCNLSKGICSWERCSRRIRVSTVDFLQAFCEFD